MDKLLTTSVWTIGGALLGLLSCWLFGETSQIAGYAVLRAILGGIARFLVMEL
jgi:hypothetical protein